MKYAKLKWTPEIKSYSETINAYANIGDHLQIFSIEYLYSKIGIDENIIEIGLNELKTYNGEEAILPLHIGIGYANVDTFFPLSDKIRPVFFATTIIVDVFKEHPMLIDIFKKYQPIACRDEETKYILSNYNIKGYIVGCVTITIEKRVNIPSTDKVYLVDIPESLKSHIPKSIIDKSIYVNHEIKINQYPMSSIEYKRIDIIAKNQLNDYKENATLIITSRLHGAVPAIAMGIPVIIVSDNVDMRFSWIDKFVRIYQPSEFSQINWEPHPIDCSLIKEMVLDTFKKAITSDESYEFSLKQLDLFYSNREKVNYNQGLRNKLLKIKDRFSVSSKFRYVIWGGGMHSYIAKKIIEDTYVNAELECIVDKFETGMLHGVGLIKPDELKNYNFDYVFITTYSGRFEAIKKMTELDKFEFKDYLLFFSKAI